MPRSLRYNYHDANLSGIKLGPRREVTLILELDDIVGQVIHLRFGGIENFDEVNEFFTRILSAQSGHGHIARVDALNYDESTKSTTHKLVFGVELDGFSLMKVRCRNVAEDVHEARAHPLL